MGAEVIDFDACELTTGLDAWITGLRGRVVRGELAGLGSMARYGVELPVERIAKILLADLDDCEALPPEQHRDPRVIARRLRVLADMWELRAQIG